MKSILGAVVTFNPDINLLRKNINSFINDVDSVIIVDNGSKVNLDFFELENIKIKVINNKINIGIAGALSSALQYASENNFDYILTMDQDSFFESATIQNLLLGFNSFKTAIVCPSLKDMNSHRIDTVNDKYVEIFNTITSGCLCDVDILKTIGGFDEKMFIDYVDFELCLRLQKNGYKIFRSRDSVLCHHLGESKTYTFFGFKIISTNHSPLRRFYYARNKIYIYKKYFLDFPLYVFRDLFSLFKTILIILFVEKMKIEKFKMILKGIWHGFFFI